jgi:hypothetical protein
MKIRSIHVALTVLAVALCATLTSPARAQVVVPDVTGHGSALQVPAGGPVDMLISPGFQPFFLGGISRMALAVSSWRLAPAVHPATALRGRMLVRIARAGR